MRTTILILFFTAAFMHTTFAQEPEYQEPEPNWDSLYTAIYYVPNQIAANVPWEVILDSVSVKYPDKTFEIKQISTTCQILKDPDAARKYPAFVLTAFDYLSSPETYRMACEQMQAEGNAAIPQLIAALRIDAATRICADSDNAEDFTICSAGSDLAMAFLEKITGIYFYRDFVQWTRRFSHETPDEKERVIGIIETWYNRTRQMTKGDAIAFFLDSLPPTGGSRFYTIENLAMAGNRDDAVRMLRRIYQDSKLPCRFPMMIAQKLWAFGVDVGTEDCMNSILNYRCMTDSGHDCARYLVRTATSHIPFLVLAEVVATERFSTFRTKNPPQTMVWETIFDEISITKNIWAEPVLYELMKIKTPVKEGHVYVYNWRILCPQQYADGYRVCDFALLKLSELKKLEGIDWGTVAGRDAAIAKLLGN